MIDITACNLEAKGSWIRRLLGIEISKWKTLAWYMLNVNQKNIINRKIKVQFADATTLIMDGSQCSLQAALNTLEIFGSLSGLKINKEKRKLIWIGKKRNSDDVLPTEPPLQRGATEFNLLG